MRATLLLAILLGIPFSDADAERLRKSWEVNLGPVARVPVSVAVCGDGSVLSADAQMPLVRVDSGGTVRSTDFLTPSGAVICLFDGYAEFDGKKVVLRRWNGRVSEYTIPALVRRGVQLPDRNLLLITDAGPMLLNVNASSTRGIDQWGPVAADLASASLAVNNEVIAVISPKRTEAEFHDVVTFRPLQPFCLAPVIRLVPTDAGNRDVSFGAGFLPDGRLAIQMRPDNRTLLVLLSRDAASHTEIDISRRAYGLLHGAGSDGCLIFSAFQPDRGKVLRKVCLTD